MSTFFLLDFCGGEDDDVDFDVGVDISFFFIKHNIIWYFFISNNNN